MRFPGAVIVPPTKCNVLQIISQIWSQSYIRVVSNRLSDPGPRCIIHCDTIMRTLLENEAASGGLLLPALTWTGVPCIYRDSQVSSSMSTARPAGTSRTRWTQTSVTMFDCQLDNNRVCNNELYGCCHKPVARGVLCTHRVLEFLCANAVISPRLPTS